MLSCFAGTFVLTLSNPATIFSFIAIFGAMAVGDELSVYCDVLATGTTSLTIAAEAIARERNGEATTKVCSGTFKFVLLDNANRPRALGEAALSANDG